MTLFEKPIPSIAVQRSSFGGGWVWGLNETGKRALNHYFGYAPQPLAPLGGKSGYMVEPQEAEDLAEYLRGEGLAWELQ